MYTRVARKRKGHRRARHPDTKNCDSESPEETAKTGSAHKCWGHCATDRPTENAKARKGESAKEVPIGGTTEATSDRPLSCSGSRFRPFALSRSPAGACFLVSRAQRLYALPVFAVSS